MKPVHPKSEPRPTTSPPFRVAFDLDPVDVAIFEKIGLQDGARKKLPCNEENASRVAHQLFVEWLGEAYKRAR